MGIHFLIALNRQGKLRISKWYTNVPSAQKKQTIQKVHRLISSRDHQKQSNFVNFENQKLVYRRYNGLFFVMAVDVQDNELSYLEMVHLMVEVLDSYFNNVCELDIIFNFYKVYQVLDEMFLSGEFQETRNTSLLTHSRDDSDQKVLTFVKVSLQFITQLSVWGLDVILGLTVVGHQVQVTIVNVQQLELGSSNEWNLHVVGRWGQVLQLLLGEDVKSNQVDLGVTVLTSLGSGHVDNLAWSTLDNNETVLSQGRTLHWVGQRGTSISGLEGVLRR